MLVHLPGCELLRLHPQSIAAVEGEGVRQLASLLQQPWRFSQQTLLLPLQQQNRNRDPPLHSCCARLVIDWRRMGRLFVGLRMECERRLDPGSGV